MYTCTEVHAQIDALVFNKKDDKFEGYGEQHMWTHRSAWWSTGTKQGRLQP
jgi:hypothetical protein